MTDTLLATLPSSGSDWLARCMLGDRRLKYFREYFSPTCNPAIAHRLELDLGDTLAYSLGNLVRPLSPDRADRLIADTWKQQTEANFTKDCYLAFHLDHFARHFRVIVAYRRFGDTFPPRRHRVMRWYEHFYTALASADMLDYYARWIPQTPPERAAVGHYWFCRTLREAAHRIGAACIDVGELCRAEPAYVRTMLEPLEIEGLTTKVLSTREVIDRPKKGFYAQAWRSALKLHAELEERYG